MGRAGVPGSNHVLREKPITAGRRIESCIKKKKKTFDYRTINYLSNRTL